MLDSLGILADVLFVHPLKLPAGSRLWTFLPLAFCIAAVYRATRARSPAELPKATVTSFVMITLAMSGIALGFYLLHQAVIRFF
ncbi:hypothetical protein RAS1_36620 [Phycisphaerae bacterium RAS1]|nr:hypothetical protein RAS1_36620 [Phycisphaerae bacterium RAS1]